MTIAEALSSADTLKPNVHPREAKIAWLSNLDGFIYNNIWMRYERTADEHTLPDAFPGYDTSTDESTELLVSYPFTDIYRFWLEAQIDLANGELDKYNSSALLYKNALDEYSAYYVRMHRPLCAVHSLKV